MGWQRTGPGGRDAEPLAAAPARVDVAAAVARRVQAQRPTRADELRPAAATALRELDGAGAGRRVEAVRSRQARQIALLASLLGDAPESGLAEQVRLVLTAPTGDPLWEDLRRLTTLLDELHAVRRRQLLHLRLRRDVGAELRGTEQVIATALRAFQEAWGAGEPPPS